MSVIYFVRHGQASFGQENYDCLSDLGYRQSEVVGDYLAGLGLKFDSAYAGSMARQVQTAQTALARFESGRAPELKTDPDFNEYSSEQVMKAHLPVLIEQNPDLKPLADEMFTNLRSFQLVFEKVMLRWLSGRYDQPDCESWLSFQTRVLKGLGRLMEENGRGKTVLLFSSGGPLSVLVQKALRLSDEVALGVNWQVRNASISEFFFKGDTLSMASFNTTAHLAAPNDLSLITYR